MKQPKLYIITRTDLPGPYTQVQSGHALAQYLIENPNTPWKNGTLIYLGTRDEEELKLYRDKLLYRGIRYAEFREPDIGNQLTAIACLHDGNIFSKLKLLGEE